MDEGNADDPFDDLFEAFELEDGPPPRAEEPVAKPKSADTSAAQPAEAVDQEPSPVATVVCTSCGAGNPAHNRHCEQCGARLGTGPLPVAPAPMIRATPGGRALTVIGGALLLVLLAVFLVNSRGDNPSDGTSTTVAASSTTFPIFTELKPFDVTASSSFPGFEAGNLIDDVDSTYWNDNSLRGNNAWLEFEFAQPVQITEIELQNLQDEEKFRRNYRIKSIVITVDDITIEIPGKLDDSTDPYRVQIGSLATTKITIDIRSTYPAQQFNGGVPFDELALQSVTFFGTTTTGS